MVGKFWKIHNLFFYKNVLARKFRFQTQTHIKPRSSEYLVYVCLLFFFSFSKSSFKMYLCPENHNQIRIEVVNEKILTWNLSQYQEYHGRQLRCHTYKANKATCHKYRNTFTQDNKQYARILSNDISLWHGMGRRAEILMLNTQCLSFISHKLRPIIHFML